MRKVQTTFVFSSQYEELFQILRKCVGKVFAKKGKTMKKKIKKLKQSNSYANFSRVIIA